MAGKTADTKKAQPAGFPAGKVLCEMISQGEGGDHSAGEVLCRMS